MMSYLSRFVDRLPVSDILLDWPRGLTLYVFT